jgi:hypothetical protein
MTKLISLFLVTHLISLTTTINAGTSDEPLKECFFDAIYKALCISEAKETILEATSKNRLHQLMKAYQINAYVNQNGIYGELHKDRTKIIKRLNIIFIDTNPEDISEETRASLTSTADSYNHTLRALAPDDAKIEIPNNFRLTRNEKNDDHFENNSTKKEFSNNLKNTCFDVMYNSVGQPVIPFNELDLNSEERNQVIMESSQKMAWMLSKGIYGPFSGYAILTMRRLEEEYANIDSSEIDEQTQRIIESTANKFNETLIENYSTEENLLTLKLKEQQTKVTRPNLESNQGESSGSMQSESSRYISGSESDEDSNAPKRLKRQSKGKAKQINANSRANKRKRQRQT